MNSRAVAARALLRVTYEGESLTDVLQHASILKLSELDQAWVRHVCFGCLRWHGRLGALLREMLAKPLKQSDKDIECLLRIGLYQLIYQRTPNHAAVNETVAAARKMKKVWAAGLINGVLRSFLRDEAGLLARADQKETARYSFPPWLSQRIKHAWPAEWERILDASNIPAPMVLRVNQQQVTPADYHRHLTAAELAATAGAFADTALQLEQAVSVSALPAFAQGHVSVQDQAAQLAAGLLPCEPGMRVLDACAAPGGKTCHLLERYPGIELLALDSSAKRLEQVNENLQRLGLSAQVVAVDASETEDWWDGHWFDRILLDAPCSATGVIRRHPDIKLLRKDADIAVLQATQADLLCRLWRTLKPGGLLLYATCSILPEENSQQIEAFLTAHADAALVTIPAQWGRDMGAGRQILPGEHDMDGFYYALLTKAIRDNDNDKQ